jgi:ParB family transcriptional regulator, chromosome partitioning protein
MNTNKGRSAFDRLGDILVPIDEISVRGQERVEFEDDNTLLELGESMKKYQLQAILLRPIDGPRPYELVVGERRLRAARLVSLGELRAHVREMTDEEAEDFRFAENIHRKNLTQIEEARRIRRDVERYGVEGTLAKHHKSRAWLSKRLSLLDLPTQTQRLIAENISVDVEVIGKLRQIEERAPAKARQLVDALRDTRGKVRARDQVERVHREVKPGPKQKARASARSAVAALQEKAETPEGTARAMQHEEAEASGSAPQEPEAPTSVALMDQAYTAIFKRGQTAATVIATMSAAAKNRVQDWLQQFHLMAKQSDDIGRDVIDGFRSGCFATDGAGAFALAAFLYSRDEGDACPLQRVLDCVRE